MKMDEEYFDALRQAKKENYEMIYNNKSLNDLYENEIRPMFGELYEELLRQAESGEQILLFFTVITWHTWRKIIFMSNPMSESRMPSRRKTSLLSIILPA